MESLVRRAFDLNSASGVVRQILDLMRSDDYSAKELTNCVERDPALTVRVLATANSARYAANRNISSVEQAVAMLGCRNLRTIVLSFSVIESLSRGSNAAVYSDFWKRSIITSLVSDALARCTQFDAKGDAFTAGMLADIGVLILTQFESERYLPIFEQNLHGPALVDAERAIFGFDHAALGARLLETWKFPQDLAIAIGAHHDVDEGDAISLSSFVRAGNLMPGAIWIEDRDSLLAAYDYVESRFNFNIDQFIALAIQVNEVVEEEAKTYGVNGIQAVDCEALQREARDLLQSTVADSN